MKTLLLLLFSLSAYSQSRTFTVSGNFPRDLFGPVDTRNLTWGHAAADTLAIKFNPPAGYRVRILKLRGDLTSMPQVIKSDEGVPNNGFAGTLMGFSTTSTAGAIECDFCAAGCFVYIQDVLNWMETKRAPFNYNFRDEWIILDADNLLNLKIAAFLNTIGVPIHVEATYTITAQWVKMP